MRIKMPGLAQQGIDHFTNDDDNENASSPPPSTGFWSNQSGVSYQQLVKFWHELPLHARKELLRIDKQTLLEHARKNMYCSRCNGLLLDGFQQIVMYGKSLQQDGVGVSNKSKSLDNQEDDICSSNGSQEQYEMPDPSVHPWGGLATTRDGLLTLLECYLCSESLDGLQKVFDGATGRERERSYLYPDACGGAGRGWISQGVSSNGRGHVVRETCALHTARISCDTLVDFWAALGEETRDSLLRLKEEDFIEKLMCRFDNKRFCRDCRRNVMRELKELKELKRFRREPRCTSWFCGPDTAFQYEVSDDTVQADWCKTFADSIGKYHHFEWAVGTGEGKSDILEFENVGMNRSARVSGLDLCGLSACFISLRAWKLDGRCTELSVKAHALKGQQCVHCRLIVGDGYVSITRGEDIRDFFEYAEEVEDEEDDDPMDKDGNDLDGECSRPQKHAKSPELAREFLLDAATVIFKEQVAKAFREGTARQNAHSMFVCLAIKLLEERLHIACKEIITLEKQIKLLEEVEREKLVNEEKKVRRKTKERERKQRRKERLKGKEKDKEKSASEPNIISGVSESTGKDLLLVEIEANNRLSSRDAATRSVDTSPTRSAFHNNEDENEVVEHGIEIMPKGESYNGPDGDNTVRDEAPFTVETSKFHNQGVRHLKSVQLDLSYKWSDRRWHSVVSDNGCVANRPEPRQHGDNCETPSRSGSGSNHQLRINSSMSSLRTSGPKYSEKFLRSGSTSHRYDSISCTCDQKNEYQAKVQPHATGIRPSREIKSVRKSDSALDMSKQFYRGNKYCQAEYNEIGGRPKNKNITGNSSSRDSYHSKKVWGPLELWKKKYPRSNSDSDINLTASGFKDKGFEADNALINSSSDACSSDICGNSDDINSEEKHLQESRGSCQWKNTNPKDGTKFEEIDACYPKESAEDSTDMKDSTLVPACPRNTSNSDNCSSCLSEGDSNVASSSVGTTESSSTSDSEDAGQLSGQENLRCIQNDFSESSDYGIEKKQNLNREEALRNKTSPEPIQDGVFSSLPGGSQTPQYLGGEETAALGCQPQVIHPQAQHPNVPFPMFQAPTAASYYHEPSVSWPTVPSTGCMPFPYPNNYVYPPLGYDWNGNSNFYMQYGAVQNIVAPVPIYQPVARATTIPEENSKIHKPGAEVQKVGRDNAGKVILGGKCAPEAPPKQKDVTSNGSAAKQNDNGRGFSLFHFGSPGDRLIGNKSERVLSEDEILNQSKTTAEYSLFNNGITFSLLQC